MRKLVNINKFTWGRVKQFSTVNECSLGVAIDLLLSHALNNIDIIETKVGPKQYTAGSNNFNENNTSDGSASSSLLTGNTKIKNRKTEKSSNDLLIKSFRGSNQQV